MAVVAFDLTPWSTRSRYRGIGTYTLDLGRALAAASPDDFELRFLVGSDGHYRLLERGAVVSADQLVRDCGQDAVTSYQRYYMQKRTSMRRFLDSAGIDVVHAPDPKGSRPGRRCRTVITAHDLIPTILGRPYRHYPRALAAAIDKARYRGHAHVVSISEWTARDLVTVAGLDRAGITVVHHGVDHRRFTPEGDRADAGRYFFYVGGFDERKQVIPLIHAFGRIALDTDTRLVIAGKPNDAQHKQLQSAIARAGLHGRVELRGFVGADELPALYRGAIAHVLPTLYEGFGLTALEAMASGCPVLTLRASCVPEICAEAALYSEPGDWDQWAANMRQVATDSACRDDLRTRGLARAAQFTWARAAQQTLDVYRAVLA